MGLEYYGSLGPVSGFDPVRRQQHLIFPAVDLKLGQMGIQRRRRVRPHSRDRRRDRQADRWLSLRFPRRPSVGRTTALCDKLLSAEPCTLQQISGRSDDGTQAGRPRYRRGRRDGAHADPSAHRERVRDAIDRHVAHERDRRLLRCCSTQDSPTGLREPASRRRSRAGRRNPRFAGLDGEPAFEEALDRVAHHGAEAQAQTASEPEPARYDSAVPADAGSDRRGHHCGSRAGGAILAAYAGSMK
jgi:hypothetical protein